MKTTNNTCKVCQTTDCIIAANYKNIGADLRIDLDNNQLDIQLGYTDQEGKFIDSDWNGVLDINYCPVCGRKL